MSAKINKRTLKAHAYVLYLFYWKLVSHTINKININIPDFSQGVCVCVLVFWTTFEVVDKKKKGTTFEVIWSKEGSKFLHVRVYYTRQNSQVTFLVSFICFLPLINECSSEYNLPKRWKLEQSEILSLHKSKTSKHNFSNQTDKPQTQSFKKKKKRKTTLKNF